MTFLEMAAQVGKTGKVAVQVGGAGFLMPVRVIDGKRSYGKIRWCVQPLDPASNPLALFAWVESTTFTFDQEGT